MQNKSCSTISVDPKTVLLSHCLSLSLSICLSCLSILHSFDMKVPELFSAVAVLVFEKIDQSFRLNQVAFKLRQVSFKLRQVTFKLRQVTFKLRQAAFKLWQAAFKLR